MSPEASPAERRRGRGGIRGGVSLWRAVERGDWLVPSPRGGGNRCRCAVPDPCTRAGRGGRRNHGARAVPGGRPARGGGLYGRRGCDRRAEWCLGGGR